MHQSFAVPASTGPGNSGGFNFSVFKALLNTLHCEDKFMVKSLLKAPATTEVGNYEEQQMTWTPAWTIWINFLPLSHGGSTWNLVSTGLVVSEKIFEHTHTYTNTHTHNLGSSEKLSPGEYTVLYPGKIRLKPRLFLPGILAGN